MTRSVVIDGVTYVPAAPLADGVRFYFMHDCHLFTRLQGSTVADIVSHAKRVQKHPQGSYGSLCPVIVMAGDKEMRRVGNMVHSGACGQWCDGLDEWIAAVQADPDICRIMQEAQR